MSAVPSFSEGQIESLAKLLGDCGSGSEITRVLSFIQTFLAPVRFVGRSVEFEDHRKLDSCWPVRANTG